MEIKLTSEEQIKIKHVYDLFLIMQDILKRDEKIDQGREHFWVCGLRPDRTLDYIELISLGSMLTTKFDPKEVFRLPQMKGGIYELILVHNHPSGNLEPSEDDKDVTDLLIQGAIMLDYRVIEHLVISEDDGFSFKDNGIIVYLETHSKYTKSFIQEKFVKLLIQEKKELKEENKEIKKEVKEKDKENKLLKQELKSIRNEMKKEYRETAKIEKENNAMNSKIGFIEKKYKDKLYSYKYDMDKLKKEVKDLKKDTPANKEPSKKVAKKVVKKTAKKTTKKSDTSN